MSRSPAGLFELENNNSKVLLGAIIHRPDAPKNPAVFTTIEQPELQTYADEQGLNDRHSHLTGE